MFRPLQIVFLLQHRLWFSIWLRCCSRGDIHSGNAANRKLKTQKELTGRLGDGSGLCELTNQSNFVGEVLSTNGLNQNMSEGG